MFLFTLDFENELFNVINLYQLYIEEPINLNGVLRILYFLYKKKKKKKSVVYHCNLQSEVFH